jgi:hypothetical protein
MISEMLLRWPRPCSGRRHALFQPRQQMDLQALHRVRSRLVSERTAAINQIRGFLLERGIIVRQGLRFLRQALPDILAKRTDVLSPRMVRIIAGLAGDWRQLDEPIEPVTDEIEILAKSDSSCRRVMTVPGPAWRSCAVNHSAPYWANCTFRGAYRGFHRACWRWTCF